MGLLQKVDSKVDSWGILMKKKRQMTTKIVQILDFCFRFATDLEFLIKVNEYY